MRITSNMHPTKRGNVTLSISRHQYDAGEYHAAFDSYTILIQVGEDSHSVDVFTNPGDTLTINGVEWTP